MNDTEVKIGAIYYIYFNAYGGPGGEGNERFDQYWKAEVIKKNEDNTYTFKYTTGEIETKKLGNSITTVNGNKAPESFSADDYFNGKFEIDKHDLYKFTDFFRQQWLAAKYNISDDGTTAGDIGNYYYIYGKIKGNYDYDCYWKATKTGQKGNVIEFTYTDGGDKIYASESELGKEITTTTNYRMFKIFTEAEYFNESYFNINDKNFYNFTPDFITAYIEAKEEYDEAVALAALVEMSGGSGKLRF